MENKLSPVSVIFQQYDNQFDKTRFLTWLSENRVRLLNEQNVLVTSAEEHDRLVIEAIYKAKKEPPVQVSISETARSYDSERLKKVWVDSMKNSDSVSAESFHKQNVWPREEMPDASENVSNESAKPKVKVTMTPVAQILDAYDELSAEYFKKYIDKNRQALIGREHSLLNPQPTKQEPKQPSPINQVLEKSNNLSVDEFKSWFTQNIFNLLKQESSVRTVVLIDSGKLVDFDSKLYHLFSLIEELKVEWKELWNLCEELNSIKNAWAVGSMTLPKL